ncbi:MAG: family 16 glycosylhydrolase [Schleiferiaceae bacterium]|nr:family 16 glycosylhydrolase [Schleiferiaceae bacterium]
MNRIFLSLVFLTVAISNGFAQALVFDDFEGSGTITWQPDQCTIDVNTPNPFSNAANSSATVMTYHDVGGQFANVFFNVDFPFELATNHTFSLKIYVPTSGLTGNQPNQVSLKLQDGTAFQPWDTQTEIIKPIVLDQWQTITFNFATDPYNNLNPGSPPPITRTDFNRVVIQVNGENNTDHVLAYIDDFEYDGTIWTAPDFPVLLWADEFDVDGPVDTSKWFHQTQLPNGNSWFNGEIQHYTDRTDNAEVVDGKLRIVAKRETFTDQGVTKQFTSARLNSKFTFQEGRVEVRAKLPTGVGTWPAIWTLGKNIIEPGGYWDIQGYGQVFWPACGEIDIMEHWGTNQNFVQSAMHTPSSFGNTVNHGGQTIPTVSTDFHVYELVWDATRMVFSVDGVVHYVYNPPIKDADTWPFTGEQYLLLNIAIEPSIAGSFTESAMEIDYVRVYGASGLSTTAFSKPSDLRLFPNPVADAFTVELTETVSQPVTMAFYQIDGRLALEKVAQHNGEQLVVSGLTQLQPGVYVVVFDVNGETYRVKMTKQ